MLGYYVPEPDEAMLISGAKAHEGDAPFVVIVGHGKWVMPFFRKVGHLPVKSALSIELLVRPDDSPLRMNGSGMLLLNPPWGLAEALEPAVKTLAQVMGEPGASWRLTWWKQDAG